VGKISPERRMSNEIIRRWAANVTGDVLSVGSGGDIDKEGKRYKDYFVSASSYTTSDIDYAMGCDLELDIRWCPQVRDCVYDCVFASGVLEHVDDYHGAVREAWRILKPGGTLLVGVPFQQPVHRAPNDFWRWTEYGLALTLKSFNVTSIIPVTNGEVIYGWWAKALKVAQ
jgi:SAM-dependent methyltransferase